MRSDNRTVHVIDEFLFPPLPNVCKLTDCEIDQTLVEALVWALKLARLDYWAFSVSNSTNANAIREDVPAISIPLSPAAFESEMYNLSVISTAVYFDQTGFIVNKGLLASSYEFDWFGLFTPPIWAVFFLTEFLLMLQLPKLDKILHLPALVVQLVLAITFNNMVLQAFFTVQIPPFRNHAEANLYLERYSEAKLYYGFEYETLAAVYSNVSLDKMVPLDLLIEEGEAATLLATQTKSIGFADIPTLAYMYNQYPEKLTFFADDDLPMKCVLSYINPKFPYKEDLTLAYLALNEAGWTYVRESRLVTESRQKPSNNKAPFSLQLEHFRSVWQPWLLLYMILVVVLVAELCVCHVSC